MRTRRFCRSPLHAGPRWRQHVDFWVKVWGDETKTWPAQLQSECKACQRTKQRIKAGVQRRGVPYSVRKPKQTLEERNAQKRVAYKKRMSTAAGRAKQRQDAREWQTTKRRRDGIPVREAHRTVLGVAMVDATALLEWIDRDSEKRYYGLGKTHQDTINRVRASGTIDLGALDRVLMRLRHEHLLIQFSEVPAKRGTS